jgi:hypothetical protein
VLTPSDASGVLTCQNNASIGTFDSAENLAGFPSTVKIVNGSKVSIRQCNANIRFEIVDGSIEVGNILPKAICSIDLYQNTMFGVNFNNHHYIFTNPCDANLGKGGFVSIGNVNKFISLCKTINGFFINTDGTLKTPVFGRPTREADQDKPIIPFEKACAFREFQKFDKEPELHGMLKEFMQQNGMVPKSVVDEFIRKNFFAIDDVALSLKGSGLLNGVGTYDPIFEICSYLDLDDVNLKEIVFLAGDSSSSSSE